MAYTSYGVNANETVKVWARGIEREFLKKTYFGKFVGTSSNSLIQRKNELQKGPGDRVRCLLRMQLTGAGVTGDGTLKGNEEALTTYHDDLLIDQIRHAVISEGKMSEQRVPFSVREEAMDGLSDWWADKFDTAMMNHLAGYTVANTDGSNDDGNNTIVGPTSTRRLFTEAGATVDEDLDSTGDEMTLTKIDHAVELAKTATPLIRPVSVNGGQYYVLFLHPYQVTSLRTSTDTGQWLDIQKAAMQGGDVTSNPIFSGALGMYNGVVLHESTRVPQGVTSGGVADTDVRRAIFCGAQSAVCAYGRKNRSSNFSWYEELDDYGNKLGVSAGSIFGIKKCIYNSTDFATIVISSYATAAT